MNDAAPQYVADVPHPVPMSLICWSQLGALQVTSDLYSNMGHGDTYMLGYGRRYMGKKSGIPCITFAGTSETRLWTV